MLPHDQAQHEIVQLQRELEAARLGNAKVIHALDCAIIWAEALFAWLPEGTVMPEGIQAAKNSLSRALGEVRKVSAPNGIPETPEEELILRLRSERAILLGLLTQALILTDQLITEMRLAGITPSGPVIFSKAEFDRRMRILVGEKQDTTPR